ncbi:MAG: DUF3090 domain-containing protein [Caldilineaceae bacterium]|jgi:uncharacterized repeat protein (TIGR03847 family)
MANYLYDLNPVQNIIADAIGEPGRRTFFLQARAGSQLVSIVMEKHDVGTLAVSVLQLLEELEKSHPVAVGRSGSKKALRPEHPMDPLFRVGQLSIGYDEDEDRIWLIAKALMVNEENQFVDPSRDDVPGVRFVASREQMRAMGEHALEVIGQGRPICPLCNRPIDRNGHFCLRTDGHALPIIF